MPARYILRGRRNGPGWGHRAIGSQRVSIQHQHRHQLPMWRDDYGRTGPATCYV